MTGTILFGDKRHTFKQTTEMARKAGQQGRKASPWNKGPMCSGKRAQRIVAENKKNPASEAKP